MKNRIYSLCLSFLLLASVFTGCKKDKETTTSPPAEYTETFFTNPADNQIYEVDSAGRKVVLMGTKDEYGMPVEVTQAMVDAPDMKPEHKLLMTFNSDGKVNQISNPNIGMMNFTYIDDTTVVIKLVLPDTLGSYQMIYNPQKPALKKDCGCGKHKPAVTGPKRADVFRTSQNKMLVTPVPYIMPSFPEIPSVKASITAVYNPGGNYVTGVIMSARYVTNDGKTGAIMVQNETPDGVFSYSLPDNPAPPPPTGFSSKVYSIFNKLCYGSIPIGLGKEAICGALAPETAGIGFVACEVILTSYVWLCRANTVGKVGSYVYDIYTAKSVDITIDASPPGLLPQTKTVTFIPSSGNLPNVTFTFEGISAFSSVYTSPSAPVALNGYTIIATLSQTGIGDVPVRLSMVGTDGYTNSEDFQVSPGGTCQLGIPGGAQGVRDDITAQIITGTAPLPGQMVKLHIIFQ